jgi:hypothetical protein
LQEIQEIVSSEEWTAETVGQALRRLLESRTNHRYQAEIQRQRIAALEEALEARVSHDRGSARWLNQLVEDLVSLSVRFHDGPGERDVGGEGREGDGLLFYLPGFIQFAISHPSGTVEDLSFFVHGCVDELVYHILRGSFRFR